MSVFLCLSLCVCNYLPTCLSVSLYVCMYVCMYVYVCLSVYLRYVIYVSPFVCLRQFRHHVQCEWFYKPVIKGVIFANVYSVNGSTNRLLKASFSPVCSVWMVLQTGYWTRHFRQCVQCEWFYKPVIKGVIFANVYSVNGSTNHLLKASFSPMCTVWMVLQTGY